MSSDHRPSPRKRDLSPPRGPRSGSERQNNSAFQFHSTKAHPRESRDRDWDRDRGRGRDRNRSRSPTYPDRYRESSNRSERRNSDYPLRASTYRPDNDNEYSPPPTVRSMTESRSSMQNPQSLFGLPEHQPATVNTMDRNSNTTSNKHSQSVLPSQAGKDAVSNVSRQDASQALAPTTTTRTTTTTTTDVQCHADGESTMVLGDLFKDLAEKAVSLSIINTRKSSSKKKLERRQAEFEKCKTFHQKYPSIEEYQRLAKSNAGKQTDSLSAEAKAKDSLLRKRAKDTAAQVLPVILSRVQKSSEDQQKIDSLEQRFVKLLEEQKTFQEQYSTEKLSHKEQLEKERQFYKDQQKQIQEQLEQRLKDQAEAFRKQREADFLSFDQKVLNTVEAVKEELSLQARQGADSVEKGLKDLDKKVTGSEFELSKKMMDVEFQLTQKVADHAEKIDILNTRTSDLGNLKSKIIKELEPELYNKLAEEQKGLSTKLESLQTSLKVIEERPNPVVHFKDIATKKELDAIKVRVKKVETPSPLPTPTMPSAPLPSDISSRIQNLEQHLNPLLKTLQLNGILELKKSSLDSLAENSTGIENRLESVEQRIQLVNSSTEPSTLPANVDLTTKMADIDDRLQQLQSHHDLLQESMAEVIDGEVADKLKPLSTKFDGYETRLNVAEEDVSGLKQNINSLFETLQGVNRNLPTQLQDLETKVLSVLDAEKIRVSNTIQHLEQALSHSVENLRARVDNINTSELARYMVGQLAEIYPNVHNTDKCIADFRQEIEAITQNLADISKENKETADRVQNTSSLQADSKYIQELREDLQKELDKLTEDIAELRRKVSGAADSATLKLVEGKLTRLQQLGDNNTNSIADKFVELTGLIGAQDQKIDSQDKKISGHETRIAIQETTTTTHSGQIGALTEEVSSLRQSQPLLAKASSPTVSHLSIKGHASNNKAIQSFEATNSNTTPQGGRNRQGSNMSETNFRNTIPSATSRQASVASAASSHSQKPNLKRKHVNGTSKSTPNGRGYSKSPHNESPRKKRQRKDPFADDPVDDPDYEDAEIPQPQVDSDDDE